LAARNAFERWPANAGKIRKLLMGILRKSEGCHKPIAEIIDLLDEMDAAVRAASTRSPRGSGTMAAVRPKRARRYTVERRRRGLHLCAYRIGGRLQPFCCPKEDYEFTATALQKLGTPVQFEEIRREVGKYMQEMPPEYLIRVCLRFWMETDPPIVAKDRTHYRPSSRGKFTNAARRAWGKLEKQETE